MVRCQIWTAMMKCKECNKEFKPYRPNQKFCSNYCYKKHWRKENKERCRKYGRNWYNKKLKHCKLCGALIDRIKINGHAWFCSEKCRIESKRIKYNIQNNKRMSALAELKLKTGCARCGYKICAASLDYHHIDPKQKASKRMLNGSSFWPSSQRMKDELKKCILLCKNCHGEVHHGIPFEGNALQRTR